MEYKKKIFYKNLWLYSLHVNNRQSLFLCFFSPQESVVVFVVVVVLFLLSPLKISSEINNITVIQMMKIKAEYCAREMAWFSKVFSWIFFFFVIQVNINKELLCEYSRHSLECDIPLVKRCVHLYAHALYLLYDAIVKVMHGNALTIYKRKKHSKVNYIGEFETYKYMEKE